MTVKNFSKKEHSDKKKKNGSANLTFTARVTHLFHPNYRYGQPFFIQSTHKIIDKIRKLILRVWSMTLNLVE